MQERYINCLKKELEQKLKELKEIFDITTIYIGGGTPSFIDSKYIKEVLQLINTVDKFNDIQPTDTEITIEVNPGTVTEQKLLDYREAGINRLSIGLQSTNNRLLKEIGRIHTYEHFLDTYNLARKVGFTNINIDLMLGLPEQKINDLKDSLNKVIDLNPEHISVYSLILEEGTRLYDLVKRGQVKLPDEELERQMYWYVKNTLELNGYKHYEISNFAKVGYESKHNMNCWKQKEYIGVGLNASSYFDSVRYSNIADLNEYLKNIEAGEFDKNRIIEEVQDDEAKQKEFMILGLRMIDGVSIQEFKNKFVQNPLYVFRKELDNLTKEGRLKVDINKIKLTNKGLDFANQVWREFI